MVSSTLQLSAGSSRENETRSEQPKRGRSGGIKTDKRQDWRQGGTPDPPPFPRCRTSDI